MFSVRAKISMAAQYKCGQLFRKFHLQKYLQAQPEVDDLTCSEAEVVEGVPEMRPESDLAAMYTR